MKSKYTRKQILEAIQYWQKQLKAGNYVMESKPAVDVKKTVHEIMESIREAVSSCARLDESEDISVKIDDVEKAVSKNIKSPSDVKRFVEKNDKKVKEKIKDNSLLSKGWQLLKDILNAGMDGISWIIKHFDVILVIVAVVSVYLCGLDRILAFFGLGIKKTIEGAVQTLADGFAAVTGPEYMAAGEKISNANVAAGGYGGWSGAGLGGGLREDEQK